MSLIDAVHIVFMVKKIFEDRVINRKEFLLKQKAKKEWWESLSRNEKMIEVIKIDNRNIFR